MTSAWTVETLKEYLEALIDSHGRADRDRFDAQEKAVNAALAAAERAVGKAEAAAEKRFDSVNEFRAQLADQARDFMPRKEFEVQYGALAARVDALTNRDAKNEGHDLGVTASTKIAIAVLGVMIALATATVSIVVAFH